MFENDINKLDTSLSCGMLLFVFVLVSRGVFMLLLLLFLVMFESDLLRLSMLLLLLVWKREIWFVN